jgi:hydroxymethylpyrimidine pyrophosphatase-like HAD family hydrolase
LQYRLVALDIDGTLLNSAGKVSPRMRAAVAAAQRAGLLVTLATGRRYVTTRHLVDELDLQIPIIIQTGALVTEALSGRRLYDNPLPAGAAAEALRILLARGLQPIVYENAVLDQHLVTGPESHDSRGAHAYFAGNPELVRRLPHADLLSAAGVGETPLELAVIDALPPLQGVVPLLTMAGCRTIISYSGNLDSYFMEVFKATCSKGNALRWLAARCAVSMDETVAIGDNFNDVEMLDAAGLGVAMGNAEEAVKAYANAYTLSNDEDGAALIIEQILAGEPVGAALPRRTG